MGVRVLSQLSGSSDGEQITVAAVATPGTLIHTAAAAGIDRLWLWGANVTAIDATITLEWGGVADPGDHAVKAYRLPANSLRIPLVTGEPIGNSKVVRAFSGTASAINVGGYVISDR